MSVIFVLVGAALIYCGHALMFNRHGAADRWVQYARRQRELGGRFLAPVDYDGGKTQVLGGWTMVLGAVFLVAGLAPWIS